MVTYKERCAFHLQRKFLAGEMCLWPWNACKFSYSATACGGSSIALLDMSVVTVLFKYLTDCSIRVSQSFVCKFLEGERGTCPPAGSHNTLHEEQRAKQIPHEGRYAMFKYI